MNFGQLIRDLRRQKGLTQRDLAKVLAGMGLDADFSYISKIENGTVPHPPSEKLIRGLAKVLEADPDELLDLAGKFDQRALQDIVTQIPEAGVLLRRLQGGHLTREQIKRILDETGK
jgi:transcriptional regulator with XRE-family HTH domain